MNKDNLTDEEVAELVQKGDKEKFGILMERYESKLFRYGKKFISGRDDIGDMVQDIFIKTYENIKDFNSSQRFSPWIYRIAHNTYVNALKKQSRFYFLSNLFDFDDVISRVSMEDSPIKESERKEIKKLINTGLDKINLKYKEILVLYYIEEFSYKEIADILHIPTSTVGIRLKRAKESLKNVYKDLNIEIKNYGQ